MNSFNNILVVFDLNQTLFYKATTKVDDWQSDCKIGRNHFYIRPHLKQLIDFLHSNKVNYCFWSNMMGRNCLKYIRQLEKMGMNKYCGIFDQMFCDKAPKSEEGFAKSIKNLNKLANSFQIPADRCILVDDSLEKGVEGCNFLHIEPFEGKDKREKELIRIIEELQKFRNQRVQGERFQDLEMLQYTKYELQQEKAPEPKKKKYAEKKETEAEVDPRLANDPQYGKLKAQLKMMKEIKKKTIEEIENLKKAECQQGEKIKEDSKGKTIRKGQPLLVEVLMFAKQKKIIEKKIADLEIQKQKSSDNIEQIKKQMSNVVKKLKSKDQKEPRSSNQNGSKQQKEFEELV